MRLLLGVLLLGAACASDPAPKPTAHRRAPAITHARKVEPAPKKHSRHEHDHLHPHDEGGHHHHPHPHPHMHGTGRHHHPY